MFYSGILTVEWTQHQGRETGMDGNELTSLAWVIPTATLALGICSWAISRNLLNRPSDLVVRQFAGRMNQLLAINLCFFTLVAILWNVQSSSVIVVPLVPILLFICFVVGLAAPFWFTGIARYQQSQSERRSRRVLTMLVFCIWFILWIGFPVLTAINVAEEIQQFYVPDYAYSIEPQAYVMLNLALLISAVILTAIVLAYSQHLNRANHILR